VNFEVGVVIYFKKIIFMDWNFKKIIFMDWKGKVEPSLDVGVCIIGTLWVCRQ